MKTHELVIAIVLALVLGVLIEIGGTAINILLVVTFGHGMFIFQHFWMLLHRPILRLVMLFAPYGRTNPYGPIILYHLFSVCAWGIVAFTGIWMFYRFKEPDEKN